MIDDTYITRQGDTWDSIAYLQYGTTDVTHILIAANPEARDYYVFPAGIVLNMPAISRNISAIYVTAPWKGAVG